MFQKTCYPEVQYLDGRQKKCKRCGETYCGKEIDVVFSISKFVKTRLYKSYQNRCAHCRQDEDQARKDYQPWLRKATSTLKRHAKKEGLLPDEFKDKYGWNPEILACRMEQAYQNGCGECNYLYSTMTEGLGALTIDIWDRNLPPYIENTRLMCTTCNKEKGTRTPEEWAIYKATRRRRDTRLAQQKKTPQPEQLRLL